MQETAEAGGNRIRQLVVPVAAFVGATAVAIVGAVATGSGEIGGVTGGIEGVAARAGNILGGVSDYFSFGYAFGAGMASAVNPCGFAMLPAYLGLYMSEQERKPSGASDEHERYVGVYWGRSRSAGVDMAARLLRALVVGLTVTLGFVVLFAAVGVPIGLGARGIADAFPWIGLLIGVLLTGAGAYLLAGGKLYSALAARMSARFGNSGNAGVRSYFTFGLAYGIASLSCTLPIFLAVIGGTFTAETFGESALQFALYGLGMGSVILALTLGMALFKGAVTAGLRRALPHAGAISAVLLLLAGTFIVYYWLTLGELLGRIRG